MRLTNKILTITILFVIYSCKNNEYPNYEFMPNMYESVGYETYAENGLFDNNQSALNPVEGSIPRGYSLYQYENSNSGYELAKSNLKNPLDESEINFTNNGIQYKGEPVLQNFNIKKQVIKLIKYKNGRMILISLLINIFL